MLASLLKQLLGRRARVDAPSAPARPVRSDRDQALAEAGRLHQLQDHRALVRHCELWLDSHPGDADMLSFLATALVASGEKSAGIDALRRAAAASSDPGGIQLSLARLLAREGAIAAAIEAFGQAIDSPRTGETACAGLADLLIQLGRYDEAEDRTRAFLTGRPDSRPLRHALTRTLFEQGRVEEAVVLLRELVCEAEASAAVHSDLLRALNYADSDTPETIFREHCAWARRHAHDLANPAPFSNLVDANKRLRVGFVSPYFRKHAVTFFLESVIRNFDLAQVEILLYSDVLQQDEYSARLQSGGALWRRTVGLSDQALAAMVRADRTDILVDLSGHTPEHRLLAFARRAAPVQMTWNGYPNTTGMGAMDYRITDAHCDPPGCTDQLHTERLLRLPAVYMSWQPPQDAPDVAPLPAMHGGQVTFASFNACYKLSPTTVRLWAEILRRRPSSRLLLLAIPPGRAEQHLRLMFANAGIDPGRLEFRPRVSHQGFLDAHASADIALDPYPYHGTTTTCFSLWMGVPVITLAGRTHVSRVGVTMLSQVGLPELVASDSNDYVGIACGLADDLGRLAALRMGLRSRMSGCALTDGAACAKALQQAMRQSWVDWCKRQGPSTT